MSSIDNCYMGHEGLLDGLSKQSSVECTWVTEVGHEEEHSLTVAKCNVPIRSYSTPKKSCFICWGYISSVYLCGCLVTLEVGAKKKAHIHIHPPSVIVLSQFSLATCCIFSRCEGCMSSHGSLRYVSPKSYSRLLKIKIKKEFSNLEFQVGKSGSLPQMGLWKSRYQGTNQGTKGTILNQSLLLVPRFPQKICNALCRKFTSSKN